jgi:hypothetical protein
MVYGAANPYASHMRIHPSLLLLLLLLLLLWLHCY